MAPRFRLAALALSSVLNVAAWIRLGEAHKPITSKYTFNEDVFPIFRDKCARCHIADGVGPMSLVTYNEAFPWAESLRVELMAEELPPWHSFALSARELDVVLVWASGGTPQGNAANKPPAVVLKHDWVSGPPDLALQMPAEFTLAADTMEATKDFVLPTGLTSPRPVRAVDLLPGTPAIVRDAVIYVKTASVPPSRTSGRSATRQASAGRAVRLRRGLAGASGTEAAVGSSAQAGNDGKVPGVPLARWMPGQEGPSRVLKDQARLPAGAELVLRVHYKKTWKHEGQPLADRSTVGLYFSESGTSRPR